MLVNVDKAMRIDVHEGEEAEDEEDEEKEEEESDGAVTKRA